MAHIRTFRSKKLHPEHVKILNEAIKKNAKGGDLNVTIKYNKPDGTVSERKIKPLGVKDKSLLLAHCHERNAIRSFRVERVSMIKQAFWSGFEKRAYDYKYEAKELNREYGARSKETPSSKSKSALIGAGIGAVGGGLLGMGHGLSSSLGAGLGALAGAGIGGALGGLSGLFMAIAHKMGIEEAKRIMKMDPKKREEYLRHLARRNEITEAQRDEWNREFRRETHAERRHGESLDAMRRRY